MKREQILEAMLIAAMLFVTTLIVVSMTGCSSKRYQNDSGAWTQRNTYQPYGGTQR